MVICLWRDGWSVVEIDTMGKFFAIVIDGRERKIASTTRFRPLPEDLGNQELNDYANVLWKLDN